MDMQNAGYPKKFRIMEGGPWWLPKPPFDIAFENPEYSLVQEFRESYKLDSVISGCRSEFEKFLLLKEWVKTRWKQHGWTFNLLRTPPRNALQILGHAKQGVLFNCLYYARLFVQCCEALGYPARIVGARTINLEFPGIRTGNVFHEISEVWSNDYRKWVLFDCDMNAHFEKDGLPLSASEICLENHRNRGSSINVIFGEYRPPVSLVTDANNRVTGTDMTPEEIKYNINEVFMKNCAIDYYDIAIANNRHDVFSNPDAPVKVLSFAPRGINPLIVANNKPYMESDMWTDEPVVFNWSVNEVSVDLRCKDPQTPLPTLIAAFSHSMPNFSHYEISMDNGSTWKKSGEKTEWNLKEGENKLLVRAVNIMGIAGPTSAAVVLYES